MSVALPGPVRSPRLSGLFRGSKPLLSSKALIESSQCMTSSQDRLQVSDPPWSERLVCQLVGLGAAFLNQPDRGRKSIRLDLEIQDSELSGTDGEVAWMLRER